jgi:hypothetical protein
MFLKFSPPHILKNNFSQPHIGTFAKPHQPTHNPSFAKEPISHPPDNDNLLKTLNTFSEDFPKEVCIFDKIIQNIIVQNGQLRRNDKKTTGREGIATADSCGIP